MDLKDICLIDVREEYEFIEMSVPGAELLPLGEVPENLEKFPMDEPVYLICASGNRSRVAGDYLIDNKINATHFDLNTGIIWLVSNNYLQYTKREHCTKRRYNCRLVFAMCVSETFLKSPNHY